MIRAFAVATEYNRVAVFTMLVDAEACAKKWQEASLDSHVTIRELVENRVLRIMSQSYTCKEPSLCSTCEHSGHGCSVCLGCIDYGSYQSKI
jgi:hypothetical protein